MNDALPVFDTDEPLLKDVSAETVGNTVADRVSEGMDEAVNFPEDESIRVVAGLNEGGVDRVLNAETVCVPVVLPHIEPLPVALLGTVGV